MRPGGITKRRSPRSRSSDFWSRMRLPIGAPRSIGPRSARRNGRARTSSRPRRSQAAPAATSSASASAIQTGGLRSNGEDERDYVEGPVYEHPGDDAVRAGADPGQRGPEEGQHDEAGDEPVHCGERDPDEADRRPAAQLLEQRVAEPPEEELLDEGCDERDHHEVGGVLARLARLPGLRRVALLFPDVEEVVEDPADDEHADEHADRDADRATQGPRPPQGEQVIASEDDQYRDPADQDVADGAADRRVVAVEQIGGRLPFLSPLPVGGRAQAGDDRQPPDQPDRL